MSDKSIKNFSDFLGKVDRTDFESFSAFLRSSLFGWICLLILSVLVTMIAIISIQRIPDEIKEGQIAPHNIKADRNYEIVDEEATAKFRAEAQMGVLPVYDMDERISDSIIRHIHEAFAGSREKFESLVSAQVGGRGRIQEKLSDDGNRQIEDIFSKNMGITPAPAQWNVLLSDRFGLQSETTLMNIIKKVMSRPLVAERSTLDSEKNKEIVVRKIKIEDTNGQEKIYDEKIYDDANQIMTTEEARKQITDMHPATTGFKNVETITVLKTIAQLLIEPNCVLNMTETEKRRQEAASDVKSAILKVGTGEMIVREGARFESWHIKVLKGMQSEKGSGARSYEFIGTFLLVLMLMVIPFYIAKRFFKRVELSRQDCFLMATVGLMVLIIMRVMLIILPAIYDEFFFSISATSINYIIPVAAGAMLIRMFLSAEVSLIFSIIISLISGLFVEADMKFFAFCMIGNFVAVISISDADRRSLIMKAGLVTGIVSAAAVICMKIAVVSSASDPITLQDMLWCGIFSVLSGIGSSVFTMITAPVIESATGYTTDIKLLELANLNHPLLRELIVRAPGTYHHSHMVGILGETAAEAIGAKALLIRVCAYYHDIGKMKKPMYFIENARPGENKHDKLSPHMSALIISAHVKDGIEMAEAVGLPRTIIEKIPEHHGTRLIGYFFEKAKEQEDPSLEKIDAKDFMYPGPKPQTREAAILMLADACEAAVRALKEKSPTRIQQTVQRVITDIFMEKQLDECELTLRDLNDISRAFIRILLGIYHARIEYPKDQEHDKTEVSIVEDTLSQIDNGSKSSSEEGYQSQFHFKDS